MSGENRGQVPSIEDVFKKPVHRYKPSKKHTARRSSNGSAGLELARAKARKKQMKELAKSEDAFTVKVSLPFCGMSDPGEVIGYINKQACLLRYAKWDGKTPGLMVRAELTDAREVWARVVPTPPKELAPHPIW